MSKTQHMWNLIQPLESYEDTIKEGVRPDKRQLLETREVQINVGSIKSAHGSALVRLGNTSVICGIKAELSQPTASEPSRGIFVPNVDLPPLCAAHFKGGPPSSVAQTHSQLIYEIFTKSLDLDQLCVCKDHLVWTLYSDIICLNYDGNITDACILAQTAALMNTFLPTVSYSEEEKEISSIDNSKMNKFEITTHPISTTFNVFNDDTFIIDPTYNEEKITSGSISIVTDNMDCILYMHRPGGSLLSEDDLEQFIKIAIKQGKDKRNLLPL